VAIVALLLLIVLGLYRIWQMLWRIDERLREKFDEGIYDEYGNKIRKTVAED